jgi:hypothetical protein
MLMLLGQGDTLLQLLFLQIAISCSRLLEFNVVTAAMEPKNEQVVARVPPLLVYQCMLSLLAHHLALTAGLFAIHAEGWRSTSGAALGRQLPVETGGEISAWQPAKLTRTADFGQRWFFPYYIFTADYGQKMREQLRRSRNEMLNLIRFGVWLGRLKAPRLRWQSHDARCQTVRCSHIIKLKDADYVRKGDRLFEQCLRRRSGFFH